mgnify:CR=1 FL=1
MKKLFLIFALTFSFIGSVSAGEVEDNVAKLKSENMCEGCNLERANLTYANLEGANLKGANLTGANLRNAEIDGAIFCNTKTPWGIDNSGCLGSNSAEVKTNITRLKSSNSCEKCNLGGANLIKADLRYAKLRYANLYKANLTGANLELDNARGVNFHSANLQDVKLKFNISKFDPQKLKLAKNIPRRIQKFWNQWFFLTYQYW